MGLVFFFWTQKLSDNVSVFEILWSVTNSELFTIEIPHLNLLKSDFENETSLSYDCVQFPLITAMNLLNFWPPGCMTYLVRVWMWGRRQQRGCQSSCRWRGAECTTCPPATSPECSWTMTDGQTHVSPEKRLVIFVAIVLQLPPCSHCTTASSE